MEKIKKCDDCIIGIGVEDPYIGGYTCTETDVFVDKIYNINSIIKFDFCPCCGHKNVFVH